MNPSFLFTALIVMLILGSALIALSQDRNWRLVITAPPTSYATKIALRATGSMLHVIAIPLSLWRDGLGFGSLMWGTMISVAACTVTALLGWRAHWLKPLALVIAKLQWRQISAEVSRK